MKAEPVGHEFRPKLIPRRGELIAWLGSLIVGVGWVILAVFGPGVNLLILIVFTLLSLVAASISLGNWMDRKTRLSLFTTRPLSQGRKMSTLPLQRRKPRRTPWLRSSWMILAINPLISPPRMHLLLRHL